MFVHNGDGKETNSMTFIYFMTSYECGEVAYKANVYHATFLLKVSFSLIFNLSIDCRMSMKDFELNHTRRPLGALMNASYYHSLLARHVCSWTTS
jgi:hypothetical protein